MQLQGSIRTIRYTEERRAIYSVIFLSICLVCVTDARNDTVKLHFVSFTYVETFRSIAIRLSCERFRERKTFTSSQE